MSRWDEVDTERARQYAWTLRLPEEPADSDEESAGARAKSKSDSAAHGDCGDEQLQVDEPSAEELADWRSRAREAAEQLAAAVERVWNLQAPLSKQARQTGTLLESTANLGLGLAAMCQHPREYIRLARLANRHWHRLPEAAREAALSAFFWIRFDHPEAADLLVELAQAGNRRLASCLTLPLASPDSDPDVPRTLAAAGLGPRLLALLEPGGGSGSRSDAEPPFTTRLLAIDWLGLALSPSAIPTLRRMLRLPHLGIRWRALDLLLHGFEPTAVTSEEVLFLLSDLIDHPPALHDHRSLLEEPRRYADCLEQAVTALRPAGGAELLEEIAFGGRALRWRYNAECDGPWALSTLAAAYPEQALHHIDTCLGSGSSHIRLAATEAAGQLPESLCQPRLLRAAADGAPRVAERARELWLERFTSVCPQPPLAGFPQELLDAPPSERLQSRLQVLRSPSQEARQAMVEALFAEAPDREALALITFAAADDYLLMPRVRRRLPQRLSQLCSRLYRQFGAPAVSALCWLAERYPNEGGTNWIWEASQLSGAARLRKRDGGPLRELALRRLESPDPEVRRHALGALAKVGAPLELRQRLFSLLCTTDYEYLFVSSVLVGWPRDPILDSMLIEKAREAWTQRNSRLHYQLNGVGFERRLGAFADLAAEVVDTWLANTAGRWTQKREPSRTEEEPTTALATQCLRHLIASGRHPASWTRDALLAPAAPAFILAANLIDNDISEETRQALLRAFEMPEGSVDASTIEVAALTLLRLNIISITDPRILRLGAHVPLHRYLLVQLSYVAAPKDAMRPLLLEILRHTTRASGEEDDEDWLEHHVGAIKHVLDPSPAELPQVLGHIQDPAVRAAVIERFADEYEDELFWMDDEEDEAGAAGAAAAAPAPEALNQ